MAETLRFLADEPPYTEIDRIGQLLMDGLIEVSHRRGQPLRIQGMPTVFHASFGQETVWDYRDLQRLDLDRYRKLALRLVEAGVWVAARGIWYISAAHGDTEVDITLERADGALSAL